MLILEFAQLVEPGHLWELAPGFFQGPVLLGLLVSQQSIFSGLLLVLGAGQALMLYM